MTSLNRYLITYWDLIIVPLLISRGIFSFCGRSRCYAGFQNSNTSVDLLSYKSWKSYSCSGGFARAPPTLRPVDRHVTVIVRLMFEQLLHGSQGRWLTWRSSVRGALPSGRQANYTTAVYSTLQCRTTECLLCVQCHCWISCVSRVDSSQLDAGAGYG